MSSSEFRKRQPRIRPVSRDVKFQRIRSLRNFKEVHQRLVDGWSADRVATFIQQECKEYLDVQHESLRVMLGEYRQTIPAHERAAKVLPSQAAAAEKVAESLDELQELERLYRAQMDRINIDLQNEKTIKKLMPSMTQEMRAAREILSDIAKLKMDLGISKRHLGTVGVDANVTATVTTTNMSPAVAKVANSAQSRRKLLGIAERILSLQDGTLKVADEEEAELVEEPSAPSEAIVDMESSEEPGEEVPPEESPEETVESAGAP